MKFLCGAKGFALVAGGVCSVETFFITNDEQIHRVISGGAALGVERYTPPIILLPMTAKKNIAVDGLAAHGGGR